MTVEKKQKNKESITDCKFMSGDMICYARLSFLLSFVQDILFFSRPFPFFPLSLSPPPYERVCNLDVKVETQGLVGGASGIDSGLSSLFSSTGISLDPPDAKSAN